MLQNEISEFKIGMEVPYATLAVGTAQACKAGGGARVREGVCKIKLKSILSSVPCDFGSKRRPARQGEKMHGL